jgi:hypothetical protein
MNRPIAEMVWLLQVIKPLRTIPATAGIDEIQNRVIPDQMQAPSPRRVFEGAKRRSLTHVSLQTTPKK